MDLLSLGECAWLSVSATPEMPLLIEPGGSMSVEVTANVPSGAKDSLAGTIYFATMSGDRLGSAPVTLTVV